METETNNGPPLPETTPPTAIDIFGMQVVPKRFDQLQPNDWNPNLMDALSRAATLNSLRTFGFVIPIVARDIGLAEGSLEIIDGEHRWQIAQEIHKLLTEGAYQIREDAMYDDERGYLRPSGDRLGLKEVCPHPTMLALRDQSLIPVINMGRVASVIARQLTLVLNQLHGTPQTVRVAELIEWVSRFDNADYIAQTLAVTPAAIEDLIRMAQFDWAQYDANAATEPVEYQASTYKRITGDLTTEEHALVVTALDTLLAGGDLPANMPRNRQLGVALVRLAQLHVPQDGK